MEHRIDAKNKKLGRLASEIASFLQGKKSVYYDPRLAGQDQVIVENVKDLIVSGKKAEQKSYYRHTGYMGHLKSNTLEQVFQKNPAKVLKMAVERMLPKNFLKARRMKRLILK